MKKVKLTAYSLYDAYVLIGLVFIVKQYRCRKDSSETKLEDCRCLPKGDHGSPEISRFVYDEPRGIF